MLCRLGQRNCRLLAQFAERNKQTTTLAATTVVGHQHQRLLSTVKAQQQQRAQQNGVTMKYILVTGGVISGVGKGVIASSFGTLLKSCGINVTSIKIDPYINIDAGTFSPFEHGKIEYVHFQ